MNQITSEKTLPISTTNTGGKHFKGFSTIPLAVYAAFHIVVICFSQMVWVDNWAQLGRQVESGTNLENPVMWILVVILFVLLLIITSIFKSKRIVSFKESSNKLPDTEQGAEIRPIVASLLNCVIMGLIILILLWQIREFTAFTIAFSVINIGIIGVSSYFIVAKGPIESISANNKKDRIDALKLVHASNISLINNTIWVSVILMASVVFISWTQGIYQLLDKALWDSPQVNSLQAITVVQLAYLSLGIFFGILSKLWSQNWDISKEIAKSVVKVK